MHQTKATVSLIFIDVYKRQDLANELGTYVKELIGEQAVVSFQGGGMGSEDFASYSYEVPSTYFMLGAGIKPVSYTHLCSRNSLAMHGLPLE